MHIIMHVRLKEKYNNQAFIKALNQLLKEQYGAPTTDLITLDSMIYAPGKYYQRISGRPNITEALSAVAVSKWMKRTRSRYVETHQSHNYQTRIIHRYLDSYLIESGYQLADVWAFPDKKITASSAHLTDRAITRSKVA